jgi:fermentation-respiration switch protein FrsA (DUF1100 family)
MLQNYVDHFVQQQQQRRHWHNIVVGQHDDAHVAGTIPFPFFHRSHHKQQVNVLCFEYVGYGLHEGTPSEKGCYDAISSAYQFLTKVKEIPPAQIILFGKGLGSGPVIELACSLEGGRRYSPGKSMRLSFARSMSFGRLSGDDGMPNQFGGTPVAGIVLQSPIASILRLEAEFSSKLMLGVSDMFENQKKIASLTCPVLFLSGTNDEVVPPAHAKVNSKLFSSHL